MSTKRFGRLQKATALVPLVLLSTAWTASLAGVGATSAVATETPVTSLPDGTSVPTEAIEAPASVSSPGVVAPGVEGNAQRVVATASTAGIPSAALAAYQRAETVINSADKSCNLSWQLIAAIGRVESDHGRTNGNSLNNDGVATPGIFGIALNGKKGTSLIRDTDAGQFDADTAFDRAVGPMQFIPSTWSVVGVDADGDAQRNPQDIDDAALGTAVYLCSGSDDLSTLKGQHSAVYRYNHSSSYVDLVLSIMNAYQDGDFTSVPNGTTAAGYFVPQPSPVRHTSGGKHNGHAHAHAHPTHNSGGQTTSEPPATTPPPTTTTEPPSTPTPGPGLPSVPGLPTPSLPPVPTTSIPPVDAALTYAEALAQCTLDGYVNNLLSNDDPFDKCVKAYTNP